MTDINVKTPAVAASTGASLLVIDIGKKQKKKDIKKLRKGAGKLTDKVKEVVDQLREENAISADAQPIVIVVREKPRRERGLFPRL